MTPRLPTVNPEFGVTQAETLPCPSLPNPSFLKAPDLLVSERHATLHRWLFLWRACTSLLAAVSLPHAAHRLCPARPYPVWLCARTCSGPALLCRVRKHCANEELMSRQGAQDDAFSKCAGHTSWHLANAALASSTTCAFTTTVMACNTNRFA